MTTHTNIWGTFEIDDATGLPALPEGFFWRVNEVSVEIRKRLPDSEWGPIYAHWGGWSTYQPSGTGESEERTKEVTVYKKRFLRKPLKTLELEYEYREINRSEVVEKIATLDPRITRENLLDLCREAVEAMEARKLYGDYPPKTLNRDKQ